MEGGREEVHVLFIGFVIWRREGRREGDAEVIIRLVLVLCPAVMNNQATFFN
jgi:hypothetical protein